MSDTDILTTHPSTDMFDLPKVRAAIDAALACASACAVCSDACLHGDDPASMVSCIDHDLRCVAICQATAEILSRPGSHGQAWRDVVRACAAVCRECAEECASHDHEHCQICAEACRRCADACEALLS